MSKSSISNKYSRLLVIVIAIFMIFSCASVSAEAKSSKTKKMNTYWSCVKSGDTVYCTSNNHNIFKVDLKTGAVNKLVTGNCYVDNLALKGKYLYYCDHGSGPARTSYLCRVNVNTGKKKILADWSSLEYVISGSKIYYKKVIVKNYSTIKYKTYVMKLNGKKKKATKTKIKETSVDSNAAGFSTWNDIDWNKMNTGYTAHFYLKTPSGNILLETAHPYF